MKFENLKGLTFENISTFKKIRFTNLIILFANLLAGNKSYHSPPSGSRNNYYLKILISIFFYYLILKFLQI